MSKTTIAPLPLEGITVIELGTIIAGPFAGSLLAEMGANVIKIEQANLGDGLRQSGPKIQDVSIWWGVASRNKKCITLNLKKPEGIELFKQLIQKADVLIENYRPGVLDKLGIGKNVLHAIQEKLIILSISGYGQQGQYASKPGFGKIAEGLSGIIPLTGRPDEAPLYTGFSLADASSGLYGSFIINMLLLNKGRSKIHIDLALYEALLEMLEFQFHNSDTPPSRQGTNNPHGWGIAENQLAYPTFETLDKHWFQIKLDINSSKLFQEKVLTNDETNLIEGIKNWSLSKTINEVLTCFDEYNIPFTLVQNGETLASHPYFRERGDVIDASHPNLGEFPVPGFFPKYPRSTSNIPFRAPHIGEDNALIYQEFLNLSEEAFHHLIDEKII